MLRYWESYRALGMCKKNRKMALYHAQNDMPQACSWSLNWIYWVECTWRLPSKQAKSNISQRWSIQVVYIAFSNQCLVVVSYINILPCERSVSEVKPFRTKSRVFYCSPNRMIVPTIISTGPIKVATWKTVWIYFFLSVYSISPATQKRKPIKKNRLTVSVA